MEELLKKLQLNYLSDLPNKINELRELIKEGCTPEIADFFHKLKGSGKTYGVPELSELGACCEKLSKMTPAPNEEVFQAAVDILDDIHYCRANNETYVIVADKRFQYLNSLL